MQLLIILGPFLSTASRWLFSWSRWKRSLIGILEGTQSNSGSSPMSEEKGLALSATSLLQVNLKGVRHFYLQWQKSEAMGWATWLYRGAVCKAPWPMKGDCSGGFEKEAGRMALHIIHFSGRGSILSLLKRDFQVKVLSVTYVCIFIYIRCNSLPCPLPWEKKFFSFFEFWGTFRATEKNLVG